ncbi:hypothetical protein D9613_012015 [Agrocybe pediades]|uniref:Uncharacterized protein n=1 Tax=Agrocybe pediades TaxID=84607 RepID=A0A8H4VHU7_9AGAR|nr:hypothetical protein D9613_012015 [Agrocybe pediades]
MTIAQGESTTGPMKESRGSAEDGQTASKIDTSIFDVFKEFELDLSCLSPPASPVPSTSELPPLTPSPPTSPVLARSTSFTSQLTIMPKKSKSSGKASSAQLSSTVPAGSRGSWPLIKYAGRGTPIDKSRRMEWGGLSGEDVAEDGVLFTSVRSTSLDSGRGQSQRSLSPEWNYLSALSSSHSQSTHSETLSRRTPSIYEPPPEIAPLQIADKIDEWDTIMKTVLSPTLEAPEFAESADDLAAHQGASENKGDSRAGATSGGASASDEPNDVAAPSSPMMSPEQIEQLNNGLEIDLGINAALDLGLGQKGGMNWFDLGLLPASASVNGRESPSVYSSQAQTPQPSAPPSVRGHTSDHRSNTSTKANTILAENEVKLESPPWWRRIMGRFRRVHSLITVHRNRYG